MIQVNCRETLFRLLWEAMGLKWGLDRKATDARDFYGIIAVSVPAGLVIQYSPIGPMNALSWNALINGVVAGKKG